MENDWKSDRHTVGKPHSLRGDACPIFQVATCIGIGRIGIKVYEASGEIRISIHCYSFGSKVILGLRDFLERRKMRPGMRNTIRLDTHMKQISISFRAILERVQPPPKGPERIRSERNKQPPRNLVAPNKLGQIAFTTWTNEKHEPPVITAQLFLYEPRAKQQTGRK